MDLCDTRSLDFDHVLVDAPEIESRPELASDVGEKLGPCGGTSRMEFLLDPCAILAIDLVTDEETLDPGHFGDVVGAEAPFKVHQPGLNLLAVSEIKVFEILEVSLDELLGVGAESTWGLAEDGSRGRSLTIADNCTNDGWGHQMRGESEQGLEIGG